MQYPGNKIVNIQALRGLAVLLVIAVHLLGYEEKFGHGYTILPGWFAIGGSGVDIFFVISGFVMVTITRGKFRKTGSMRKFIYHRLMRIYPTYWFYSLFMLAFFLMQRKQGDDSRIVDITASFLLLPQNQWPLLVVGWTLVHEVYFYLVFSLLLAFHERWLLPLMLLWGVTSVAGSLLLYPIENPALQLITNPLTLEFIAGCLIARLHFSGNLLSGWPFLVIALAWWLIGYGFCVQLGLAPESSNWLQVLIFGIPAAIAVYALVSMEKKSKWQLPGWLVLIGDSSYSVYLSHTLVFAAIWRIWGKFGVVGSLGNGIVIVTMLLSSLVIGKLSFQLIERPLLKFTRRLESVW
jgi:peptidoglycan/LPS O-acetylase OafA/YrhL